jgi:hypothetical protein
MAPPRHRFAFTRPKDARKDASARRGEQAYSVRKAAVDWDDGETYASTPNKKARPIREDLSGFTATPRNVNVS